MIVNPHAWKKPYHIVNSITIVEHDIDETIVSDCRTNRSGKIKKNSTVSLSEVSKGQAYTHIIHSSPT